MQYILFACSEFSATYSIDSFYLAHFGYLTKIFVPESFIPSG